MDRRHLKGPSGVGELPRGSYPQRTPFDPMTAADAAPPAVVPASQRQSVQIVQRARMVNYPFTITFLTQAAIKALSENLRRAYLAIQVKSTSSVGLLYVNYGTQADATQIEITAPGGFYEWPVVPVDAIFITASAGTMQVVVTEGTEV